MAHEIDMSNNRANMAYAGQVPWHGLGYQLQPGASIEEWREAAGLAWDVINSPVLFMDEEGTLRAGEGNVLVRDDTHAPLGLVSDRYQVLQPGEILEFYRSLTETMGFQLETAGSLRGGKRVWALARTGQEARIKGQDELHDFILLATSYDGTMATIASRTSVRVVCMNTFRLAVGEDGAKADVKVPHHSVFDPEAVKAQLGIGDTDAWSAYVDQANALTGRKIKKEEAIDFFLGTYYGYDEEGNLLGDVTQKATEKRITSLLSIYEGGVGQDTRSAKNTAWGLVNAVTRYEDHERQTREPGNRLNSAWFGDGERRKQAAWAEALALVA